MHREKIPEKWRESVPVPILKNKGDVQSCSNYSWLKLMNHTMKIWERVAEARQKAPKDAMFKNADGGM